MKRLFSILLMNAWGGIRHMPGLYTAVMVLISAMALIVASNVTAGASPDLALSSQQQSQSTDTHLSAVSHMLSFFGVGDPTLPTEKKAHKPTDNNQPKKVADEQSSNTTPAGTPPTSVDNQQNSTGIQSAPVTLGPLVVQSECVQGQMTYSVKSAQLSFQNPTTAKSTVTWQWVTRIDSGTNTSGNPPAGSSPDSQTIPAGTSDVALTASDGAPELFTATASQNYSYSFRLDVVVNGVDVLSTWDSVPQAAGVCRTSTNN